mmetsp:Transcript_19095/g.38840  ORF Transcript_19095/g.38840 Transcript_19095/m.38840 type:complete len:344 (-) Transcript_19095:60-1091(-)
MRCDCRLLSQTLMSCLTMSERKEVLDSATAWGILVTRWKGSHRSAERKTLNSENAIALECDAPAAPTQTEASGNEDMAEVYLKYIEQMNKHISLQSVADKAAESWKSAAKTKLTLKTDESNLSRRPSEDLFDFLNNADSQKPAAHHQSLSVDHIPLSLIRETSNTSQVSQTSSAGDCASPKTFRARKRDSIDTPACTRHSGRRRCFSRPSSSPDCTCQTRRRSSLLFPSPASSSSESQAASSSSRALPSSPVTVPIFSRAQSRHRRSFSSAQLSLFAEGLTTFAADIPAGDPRIGELYGAAARSFGPPQFIPAKMSGGSAATSQAGSRRHSRDSDSVQPEESG